MNPINPNDIILFNNVVHHYEEGSHKTYIFELPSYYQVLDVIGKGAYGIVISAVNKKIGMKVAIKKIPNLFEQNKCYQKRILREVKIMRHVSSEDTQHDNVLTLVDLIPPFNYQKFRDMYIATVLMDYDLTRITKVQQSPTQRMVKYCIYQLLSGVNHLHKMNIVHRDMKPGNILINNKLDVKICDFGLSRGLDEGGEVSCTYVATRWYRAPELCLAWKKSGFGCDVWSIGCIMAELIARPAKGRSKVLFPGFNYLDQLRLIFEVIGKPKLNDLQACDDGRRWVRDNIANNIQRTNLRQVFPHVTNDAIDLLSKLLVVNPLRRVKASDALEHPFLREIHNEFLKYQELDVGEESEDDESEDEGEEENMMFDHSDGFNDGFTGNNNGIVSCFPNDGPPRRKNKESVSGANKFMFRFDENRYNSPDDIKRELYREIRQFYDVLGFRGKILVDNRPKHINCNNRT